jgi:hypothetical protein
MRKFSILTSASSRSMWSLDSCTKTYNKTWPRLITCGCQSRGFIAPICAITVSCCIDYLDLDLSECLIPYYRRHFICLQLRDWIESATSLPSDFNPPPPGSGTVEVFLVGLIQVLISIHAVFKFKANCNL